jgi:hypothetical protein
MKFKLLYPREGNKKQQSSTHLSQTTTSLENELGLNLVPKAPLEIFEDRDGHCF